MTFKDWNEIVEARVVEGDLDQDYERFFVESLGRDAVVLFNLDDPDAYEANWNVLVASGELLGLIEGTRGCCSGCDSLIGLSRAGEHRETLGYFLNRVRTFASWSELSEYFGEDGEHAPQFAGGRERLLELAHAQLDMRAVGVFSTLRAEAELAGSSNSLSEIVKMSNLLV